MSTASTEEKWALLGIIFPTLILVGGYMLGWFALSEISSAVAYALVTIMLASGGYIVVGRLLIGTELAKLVMKTADRGFDPDRASRLKPKFTGIHALFFWPKKVSWEKGQRNPYVRMPYMKVVIKGKDAYWWGVYADDLFQRGCIEYNSAPGDFENDEQMETYLKKKGYILHPEPFPLGTVG